MNKDRKGLDQAFWQNLINEGKTLVVETADLSVISNTTFKDLRNRLNFTQNKFANILGVSKKTIEKWEQGVNPIKGPAARLVYLFLNDATIIDRLYRRTLYDYGEYRYASERQDTKLVIHIEKTNGKRNDIKLVPYFMKENAWGGDYGKY